MAQQTTELVSPGKIAHKDQGSTCDSPPPATAEHARTKELLAMVPAEDQSHLVEAATQKGVGSVPKRQGRHFLVALDPDAKHGQTQIALELVKRLSHPGDVIVLLSVLDPVFLDDPGMIPLAVPYSAALPPMTDQDRLHMLASLKRMREKRADELSQLVKEHFPDHDCYVHVVHGSPDKKILWAAEKHESDVIVIGKRKLGRFEQLFYHSVSNYVSSHANCTVIVAK